MKLNYWWIVGLVVAFIAGGALMGRSEIGSFLPFVLLLACPVMMIFMMRGHKH